MVIDVLAIWTWAILWTLGERPGWGAPIGQVRGSIHIYRRHTNMTIDMSPLLNYIVEILSAILAVVIPWIAAKVSKLLGLKKDSEIRGYVEQGLLSAKNYGVKKARQIANKHDEVDIENKIAATAAQYMLTRFPDAVTYFKLDDTSIQEMVRARLGADDIKEVQRE